MEQQPQFKIGKNLSNLPPQYLEYYLMFDFVLLEFVH